MPSANSPPSQTAITTPPRDILLDFQFRRENRALLDAFEEQRAKAAAESETQRLRLEEVERMIQLADQQRKDMEEQLKEKLNEMGEHVRERDEGISKEIEHGVQEGVSNSAREIERNVVEQLSARLPSGTFVNAIGGVQDDEGQQQPGSSPPAPRGEARKVPSQAQPQSALPAPAGPVAIIPPPQRYALRRAANADAAAAGPRSAPQTTASTTVKGREIVGTRANLSRKRSVAGVAPPTTPATPATPVTAPATRERSSSTSSTLSTAPSSHADEPVIPPPVIPDLPFNKRGTPTQGDLDVDIYFAAAKKFARDRQVHEESEEAQATFIVQVIKGMKKEERAEIVAALEQGSLAKMDTKKRTVQFLGLWREIEEAVGAEVLAEAKAKGNFLRATAVMVGR